MLVAISEKFGRRAHAIVSDMNEPLGHCIGTGIEVVEAREVLRGRERDERVLAGCLQIATAMLELGGIGDARVRALHAIENGSAYAKFVEMVEAQGGSRAALEALAPDTRRHDVRATESGVVRSIDAVALGNVARRLTNTNPRAGLCVAVRIGERSNTAISWSRYSATVPILRSSPTRLRFNFVRCRR